MPGVVQKRAFFFLGNQGAVVAVEPQRAAYSDPGLRWWLETLPRIPTTIPWELESYLHDLSNYLRKASSHFESVMRIEMPPDLTKDYRIVWNSATQQLEWEEITL